MRDIKQEWEMLLQLRDSFINECFPDGTLDFKGCYFIQSSFGDLEYEVQVAAVVPMDIPDKVFDVCKVDGFLSMDNFKRLCIANDWPYRVDFVRITV